MKLQTKRKWLLTAKAVVCAGVLFAIPLYANRICPPDDGTYGVTYLPNNDDCRFFFECYRGFATSLQCPKGLYFCVEKTNCDWPDAEDCSYDHCR